MIGYIAHTSVGVYNNQLLPFYNNKLLPFYKNNIEPIGKTVYDETSRKVQEISTVVLKEYRASEEERLIKKGHYVALGLTVVVCVLTVGVFGVTAVPIASLIFGVCLLLIINSIENGRPKDPKGIPDPVVKVTSENESK